MTFGPLALASVTAVAALSFARVFSEATAALPALFAALVGHAVIQLARRGTWGPATTVAASLAGLGAVGVWAIAPHTTAWGAPTPETVSVLGERLVEGFSELSTASVPVDPHSGVVVLATLGTWLAATASDWVAFRARATLAALIPAATLFTITAALGTDQHEAVVTAGFVAAALLFLLMHAPAQADQANAWFRGRDASLSPRPVLWAGVPLVLVAALVAPLLGPRLPEARSTGLLDLTPQDGPRTRVTVSPLIDIRDRLTRTPAVDVFTVAATRPAYWRMAALETYDGQIWSSLADYESADSTLPPGGSTEAAPSEEVVQRFRVSNLAQFWLPAAYRPVSIDLPGARVNPDSLTLLTDQETAAGLEYSVVSHVPAYGPADLTGSSGEIPSDVEPMLELPADTPPVVPQLAREATAGTVTDYEAALALQNWFRDNFSYSEVVPAGHSGDRMTDFLTVSRAGYCEQFSAAFAVMARSLGVPARVAVGFTPGTLDPDRGVYQVTTEEAHAWPEVWIAPYGWVAFEPTPTRSDPSPANHTGTYDPTAPDAAPSSDPGEATDTTAPPADDPSTEPPPETELLPPEDGGGQLADTPWPRRLALGAALLAVLGVGGGMWWFRRSKAQRARRLATLPPRDSILVSWDLLVQRLRREGIRVPASLTPAESAVVAAAHRPELWAPMDRLREHVELAAYAPVEPGPGDLALVRSLVGEIDAVLSSPRSEQGAADRQA